MFAGSGAGGFAGFNSALTAAAGGNSGSDLRSIPELIALAVNLAHNKRTAEVRLGASEHVLHTANLQHIPLTPLT